MRGKLPAPLSYSESIQGGLRKLIDRFTAVVFREAERFHFSADDIVFYPTDTRGKYFKIRLLG